MKIFDWFDWFDCLCFGIIFGFVIMTVILIFEAIEKTNNYKIVCIQTKGQPVYDGRQWQCIKPNVSELK